MNNKYGKFIIALIICTSIVLMCSNNSDNTTLDEVKLKDNIEVSKKQFAMYTRDSDEEEYQEYTGEDLFPKGYKLDVEQSGCIDSNGNEIKEEGILTQTSDNKITLKSNKTVYCYLYFDKKEPTAGDTLKDKVGKDGLIQTNDNTDLSYRYIGNSTATINNYICFGTTTKSDCTASNGNNTYMYRIIGIDRNDRLKLIKNIKLETNQKWHSSYQTNTTWSSTALNSYLNTDTNGFYNNSSNTYIPSDWKSKIDTSIWNIGNSKEIETDSDKNGVGYGSGKTQTGLQVCTWEQAYKTSSPSKIGLMYLSDYYYSLDGTGSLNCYFGSSDYVQCKTSWLHISNNGDNSSKSLDEWTMSRYGYHSSLRNYYSWAINDDGSSIYSSVNNLSAVRPVFYLINNVTISSGSGSLDDPYIIK